MMFPRQQFVVYVLLATQIDCFRKAIEDLSTGLSIETSNVECLYLRGSCYHAIGQYREAVIKI